MDDWATLLELSLFYGGAMAFGAYQLWSLKKLRAEDEARPEPEDGGDR